MSSISAMNPDKFFLSLCAPTLSGRARWQSFFQSSGGHSYKSTLASALGVSYLSAVPSIISNDGPGKGLLQARLGVLVVAQTPFPTSPIAVLPED